MRAAGIISLWLALASTLGFVLFYTYLAPWWRDSIMQTIVVKDILLIALFIITLLDYMFPGSRILAYAGLAFLFAITPVMAWRGVAFWKDRPPLDHRLPAQLRPQLRVWWQAWRRKGK